MCTGRTRENPPFGWVAFCAFVISALSITSLSTPWFQATITTQPSNSTITGTATEFSFKLYNNQIRVEQGGVTKTIKYSDLVLPSTEVVVGVSRAFSIVVLIFSILVWVSAAFAHVKDIRLVFAEWALIRTFFSGFIIYALLILGFAIGSWISIAGGLAVAMDDDDIMRQLSGGTESCQSSFFDCTTLARRETKDEAGTLLTDIHFPSSAFIVSLFTTVIAGVMMLQILFNFRILQLEAPAQDNGAVSLA